MSEAMEEIQRLNDELADALREKENAEILLSKARGEIEELKKVVCADMEALSAGEKVALELMKAKDEVKALRQETELLDAEVKRQSEALRFGSTEFVKNEFADELGGRLKGRDDEVSTLKEELRRLRETDDLVRYNALLEERKVELDGRVKELEHLLSENVSEVRKELEEYMTENVALEWEAVIEIQKSNQWERWEHLGLKYTRKFRARKVDGSLVYRSWSYKVDDEIPEFEGARWEDCLTGHPGAVVPPDDSTTRMKYTPERWEFLRAMTRKIEAIQEAMKAFLRQSEEELVECLEGRKVFAPIATRLLPTPEDSDE